MLREPAWECDVSEFKWHYDNDETCLVVKGQAVVDYAEGSVVINIGDIAVFPKGLDCVWKVTSPIKKHYR
jgi:uncharacterized cupin superfamily protein